MVRTVVQLHSSRKDWTDKLMDEHFVIITLHFTKKVLREDTQLGLAKERKEIELSICLHEYARSCIYGLYASG